MRKWAWLSMALVAVSSVFADQFQIPIYRDAEKIFWEKLYEKGGWTLYCGERFDSQASIVIEHVYPMTWAREHLQCQSEKQCRQENAQYNRIESDLHNLYPAMERISQARADYRFDLISGEYRDFFECDFEHDAHDKLVEPRPAARGNVARAIFYMHTEYGLPLDANMLEVLKQWNKQDEPSKDEIRRNDLIEKLQGTRNVFIDDPSKGDDIGAAVPTESNAEPVSEPQSDSEEIGI